MNYGKNPSQKPNFGLKIELVKEIFKLQYFQTSGK